MADMKALVLAVPGLHLGYVGCYGCEWVQTPHLDRLASEGVVFDRHYADSLAPRSRFHELFDALPNRSWWTGRYHFQDSAAVENLVPSASLFPQLEAHGVTTLRIVTHSRMVTSEGPALKFPRRRLLNALAEVKSSPLLVWVDLPSLAPPWPDLPKKHLRLYFPKGASEDGNLVSPWLDPPAGAFDVSEGADLEQLQATYATMVTYFDAQVGRLLAELREHQHHDDLLLIVTGDRGLTLGEHGWVGETAPGLHEELVHLPLIIRQPGGNSAGRRVAALTQPVDLYPTLLEAFGVPQPENHGRSLLPLLRDESCLIREVACSGHLQEAGSAFALRTPEWSLIVSPQKADGQLFVQPDDRWEVNDVRQHHQELAQNLQQQLNTFIATTRQ
jgi:arylsulfatase A-like enzyme